MTLSDKQALFCALIAKLVTWANGRPGVRVRFGWVYDPPGSDSGRSPKSLHRERLAADLILDLWDEGLGKWSYQRTTAAYEFLGKKWRSLDPLCEWGGSDGRSDGNHFSLGHGGRW